MVDILFVDDDRRVLDSLRRMLSPQREAWQMTFVDRSSVAWEYLRERSFDAAVLDVRMPGISGLELLARIQQTERARDMPVVMLTGLAEGGLKRQALELGAADLLLKPVERADLLARLRSVLRLKACEDELRAQNRLLEQRVEQRTTELFHSRLDIIWRLGRIAEHRDELTGNHVIRVGFYSRLVSEALGTSRGFQESVFLAAPLHDIGKIAIPDRILLKRGPLTAEQWTTMKRHCAIGASILREESPLKAAYFHWRAIDSQSVAGEPANPILDMAATIALTHHERWDGDGYPEGLAGEEIPLESRIVAICDVYDALTSHRPYRNASGDDHVLEIIRKGVGSHFDPAVVAAMLEKLPAIEAIRQQFADRASHPKVETALA
jgi:putative two-component system response regulator